MQNFNRYKLTRNLAILMPNFWDLIVISIILGLMFALAWGAKQMNVPYALGKPILISLDPIALPKYAVSTVIRMFIALFFSLSATFILAPLAAKNRHTERIILPFVDIMQSIPVLGMLSITVVGFIRLFPNSMLGPECAAIFAIFTSQAWNMILSLYQSLRTIPHDIQEAAAVYQLSAWQRFWRVELPFATPGLLWNTMMSMSAGWFFVVLSEAISVANQNITLPGIGSYIGLAILKADLPAIGYAILTMLIVILIYDQLLFRPLLAWADKFKAEIDEEEPFIDCWFYSLLAKTNLLKLTETGFSWLFDLIINIPKLSIIPQISLISQMPSNITAKLHKFLNTFIIAIWYFLLILSTLIGIFTLTDFIKTEIDLSEVFQVLTLGLITGSKVIILIIASSILWIPIGVWIGLKPQAAKFFQPLIQFLAAFPANLFYPIAVLLIVKFNLNKNIWTMPLMILGTQWYILFNVIAGSTSIPKELKLAVKNFGITGRLWWQRLILPAIFPYYITGAMTAAGGCWNASIVAEFVQWGEHTIIAPGLGSYITEFTRAGDFPRIALGIAVMCLYVMLFNRLIWHKLYALAEERFSIN